MILLSIRDLVEEFAQRYGLNTWDWITLSITMATFFTSFVALIVAYKTLKSQQKTEANTTPDLNVEIQLSLFGSFMNKYLLSIYSFLTFNFALVKTDFETKPTSPFWSKFINPNDYLFERVFYSDAANFTRFKEFISTSTAFKNGIDRLKVLYEKKATKEEIKDEIDAIQRFAEESLFCSIHVLHKTFELSEDRCLEYLENLYFPLDYDVLDELKRWIKNKNSNDRIFLSKELDTRIKLHSEEREVFDTLSKRFSNLASQLTYPIMTSLTPYGEASDDCEAKICYEFVSNRITSNIVRSVTSELHNIEYRDKPFYYFIFPNVAITSFEKSHPYKCEYTLIDLID